jgi:hypothetical protein
MWAYEHSNNEMEWVETDEADHRAYVSVNDGTISCLNLGTGEEIWTKVAYFAGNAERLSPSSNYVFGTGSNSADGLVKFDKTDGTVLDSAYTGTTDTVNYRSVATYNEKVYYCIGNTIYRRDAETFSIDAQATLDNNGSYIYVDSTGVYVQASGIEKWDTGLTTRSWVQNSGNPEYIERYGDALYTQDGMYNATSGRRVNTNGNIYGVYPDGSYFGRDANDGWGRIDNGTLLRLQGKTRSVECLYEIGPNGQYLATQDNRLREYHSETGQTNRYDGDAFASDNGGGGQIGRERPLVYTHGENDDLFVCVTPGAMIYKYAREGNIEWTHTLTDETAVRMIPDGDGGVFIGSSEGNVIHLDSTGSVVWSVNQFPSPVNRMIEANGLLYLSTKTEVRAVSKLDGVDVWTYDTGTHNWVYDITADDSGNIFVACEDREFKELDSGSLVNTYEFSHFDYRDVAVPTAIDYHDGFFFVGDTNGRVWKMSDTFVGGWHWDYQGNLQTVWNVCATDNYVFVNDSQRGQRSVYNIPVYVAKKKCRVHLVTRVPSDIFHNGYHMDSLEDTNASYGGNYPDHYVNREYEFTLAPGDTLSSREAFWVTGIELE